MRFTYNRDVGVPVASICAFKHKEQTSICRFGMSALCAKCEFDWLNVLAVKRKSGLTGCAAAS